MPLVPVRWWCLSRILHSLLNVLDTQTGVSYCPMAISETHLLLSSPFSYIDVFITINLPIMKKNEITIHDLKELATELSAKEQKEVKGGIIGVEDIVTG